MTCPLGIHMVGYSMICFGLTGAASSYASGKLIKHTGRIAIYVTGRYFEQTVAHLSYFTHLGNETRPTVYTHISDWILSSKSR